MKDLIAALEILLKYGNPEYPTHCEHDVLIVMVDPKLVSKEDIELLDKLGFIPDTDGGCFKSFRFGSA